LNQPQENLIVRAGSFFFRFRDFLFPAVFIALAIGGRPHLFGGSLLSDLVMDLLGVSLVITGHAIRAIVIGYVYIERGGKNKRVHASKLVQGGVFAHCRNPLYVGNILVYMGLILTYNAPLMYAVGLPFFLFAYYSIVNAEENFLRTKFGKEYVDYCARVPRFLLSLKGVTKTFACMEYDWKRTLRKDYGSVYASTVGIISIMMWERISNAGVPDTRGQLQRLVLLLLAASLGYILARYLKKSGRLDSSEEPIIKPQGPQSSRRAA